MKKILLTIMAFAITTMALQAKTRVAYYSFTNNCRTIATDLKSQLSDADLVGILPAEEGLDYAANNYAIGSRLIQTIRDNPNDASSYPAIKDVNVDFSQYDDIVIVTPLWWSNMAAPMQTFLFQNGRKMTSKKVGLIVSSASSGISSVVADAKRLIPDGIFTENLWIRSSQVSNCHSMIYSWISSTGTGTTSGVSTVKGEKGKVQLIFPASGKASNDYNTGEVKFSMLKENGNTMIAHFLFSPGSRNFWHYHPEAEQTLLVLDGEGYYQEEGSSKRLIKKGDYIVTPANVRHWNGATSEKPLVCITVTEHSMDGHAVQLRAVTDEEYSK